MKVGLEVCPAVERTRWVIVVMLFLATVLNYLDRQILSMSAPVLQHDLRMNAQAYSWIVTSFLTAYTLMQAGAGRAIDAVGYRVGLLAAVSCWSVAGALHGLCGTAVQLGICRALLGAGEAGNWPAAVKAVRELFAPCQRAFAVGLFNSGSALGAVLAPPLVASLSSVYSWRAAFLLTGSLGVLWAVVWWMITAKEYSAPAYSREERGGVPLRQLMGMRAAWAVCLARFFADPVWWFYIFWLPDYLSRVRGLSLQEIGVAAWIPFLFADLGNLVGGAASGRLVLHGWAPVRARVIVMAASAAAMVASIFITAAATTITALALVSLAAFAYSAWAANILTLPSDLFEDRSVASVVGASGSFAGVGGIVSTLLIGFLVDRHRYALVFTWASLSPLAAFAVLSGLLTASLRESRNTTIASSPAVSDLSTS